MKSSLNKVAATLTLLLLMVVGAFSAPATKAKNVKPPTPKAADCSRTSAETLKARVTAKISETAVLAGQYINVEAESGVVTLRGNVISATKKRIAARTAASVKCVKRVVNLLVVTEPFKNYECCCNGECWIQSRPCQLCDRIKPCRDEYHAAIIAAAGNKDALAAAWDAFHACICKESQ